MSYSDRVDATRRLIILRALVENGGSASEAVLETVLIDLGERLNLDREAVRNHLKFLKDADLVEVTLYRDKIMVGHITARGVALTERRIKVDGVQSPSMGV